MGEKIRILIADDDPDVRQSLTLALALDPQFQYETETAATVEETRMKMHTHSPQILLLDNHFPDSPRAGLDELLPEFAAQFSDTTIIIITALRGGDTMQIATAKGWGAVGFLDKPFSNEALYEAINKAYRAWQADHNDGNC
ncbi:MAG: response regulator [Sulfuricella sp.]|nr:response regulator [Sulfuricella sp.]